MGIRAICNKSLWQSTWCHSGGQRHVTSHVSKKKPRAMQTDLGVIGGVVFLTTALLSTTTLLSTPVACILLVERRRAGPHLQQILTNSITAGSLG